MKKVTTSAMLILALNRTFVAASRSPSAFAHHARVLSSSTLPRTSTNAACNKSIVRMVSSAEATSTDPAQKDQKSPENTSISPLHTVMVHRNRQSAAFREGTPLIFGGSIASTFSEYCDGSDFSDETIPMGALVSVVVSRDSSKGSGKKGGKRNGKGNARSRDGNDAPAPHHGFLGTDAETNHWDVINKSQLIGYGVFNPESMYRVRLLCHETMHPRLAKEIRTIRKSAHRGHSDLGDNVNTKALQLILERKLSDAIHTRIAMNLSSESTNTYRLCNGEGDGLSGLAIDILGGSTAIVMSSAAWCEIHKDTILSVLETSLEAHPAYEGIDIDIVWRNTPSRLKQDGYALSTEDDDDSTEGEKEMAVVATESSVKYLTYPYSDGQKTGFYCDQRDNRLMVAELCKNKRVLDLCCYNGGFALNAMIRGAAASATGVDSSQDAVDAATANAELNSLSEMDVSFVKDDISAFMKSGIEAEDEYDVIVLDPPKLAPSLSSLDKASRKYHALNRDAMNLINKSEGGLLLTCTCSAAMTQKDGGQYFLNMVNGAALSAKRRVTLLKVSGAAPCHTQAPASFPAGAYLTAALFHVGPADL